MARSVSVAFLLVLAACSRQAPSGPPEPVPTAVEPAPSDATVAVAPPADAPPPLRACPRGMGAVGPGCWLWHCQTDADCAKTPGNQPATGYRCEPLAMCGEDVMRTGKRGPNKLEKYPDTEWHGPCDADGTCAKGTCRPPEKLCVVAP